MAKRKKGYRRVYDEGTGKTKLGRRKEVDVYRPFTNVGKTLVKDITYKSEDSPRVKYTEREVTRRNKDGSVKSYKNIVRKNGKIVDEATTKKIKYDHGGPHDPPKVKQRKGVRENYDYKEWTPSGLQFPTSVSSHLMKAEYVDDIDESTGKPVGWVGFPSLFQDSKPYADDQDNWAQTSEDNGWWPIYEKAKRRGEVYNFGEDKEAAIAFGEGSWKDQLPDEGMEVELTDEEVEEYRAGGYVLEELADGGENDLITYKNNKKLIDGVVDWQSQSDVNISLDYNDQIKARLLTGNYGYNPKTGELVKLSKSQQTKVTDKYALDTKKTLKETAGMSSKEYEIFQDNEKEAAKQNAMSDYTANRKLVSIDKADEWNPSFTIQNESGQNINTQDYAGKQVYMTDVEEAAYKKTRINKNIPIAQQQMNTLFSIPASFTPAGLGIMGVHGAANLGLKSGPEFVENPSWGTASAAGLDLLTASPLVIPAGISAVKGVNNLKNVKVPYPKMDLNKLGSYPISKEALPTTVKGSEKYIRNFKPKQTLQLESTDMKFDRALADINRKSSDNPILTRVFNEGEFADDLSGLKVGNRTLVDGTTQGRRTKHFGVKGEGASMQGGNDVYNNMYIGNIDDVSGRSGAHLRDFHAGDTYFYTPNKTFTLSDEGVYLTSDPKTYEKLYKSGKKVKLEPGVFDDTKNLDEFISTDDKKILEDFSKYYENNPSKVGSQKISTKDINRNPGPQFNQINQTGHQYDILSELENLKNIPFMVSEGRNAQASLTYSKNGKLNPLFEFDPRYSANELKSSGYDISFYNQWVNLPKKVRQAELDKLANFYVDNILTEKVSPSYRGGASQYQEDYIKVLDELQMLHDKAGPGLKYKKGGYIEAELTDKEVAKYKAGGYTLEEMHEGGDIPLHNNPHDPPSYEDAMQAYKDSIAARAAYEDQYKLDLAQYEKDSVNLKKRNTSYNKKLDVYNKAQDKYARNQAYLKWLKAKYPAFPTYDEVYDASDPSKGIYYYEHMSDTGQNQKVEYAAGNLNVKNGGRELYLSPYYDEVIEIAPGNYNLDEIDRLGLDSDNIDEFTAKYLKGVISDDNNELNSYNEFIDWGMGRSDANSDFPVITMLAPPNIKKPKSLEEQILKAVEYNPPKELERPSFSNYVDSMPVIKPELITNSNLEIIGDYNEPEELERPDYSNYEGVEQVKDRFNLKRKKGHYKDRQRVSAKIAQALTGYDAEKMDAEIEAADKEGRRINFEGIGLGAVSNKRFRKKYNKEYDKYEEALQEQEYLNSMPMFFKDGGSMELDLSPEEVTMYANGGYILEEIPQFAPGGVNDPGNPLSDWANQQASLWENLHEYDPKGRDLATSYFQNIGDDYNLSLINKGKMPAWSAATISNAVMANIGATDKQTAQILGFNPTASHSGYVRDAFKASKDPEYKYNRYVAEGVSDSDYGIGDILVKGRSGTKNWKYGDFKKANDSYESHGDIIVDRGKDDKGEYVILAGGNLSDTYKNKKVYLSNLKNNYTVKLTDAKRGERRVGSSQKSNNLGEDVTINEKESSPFANNFDWNAENDQTAEDVNQDPFPISSFDNSSKLVNSNQQALFGGADTLGIGYVPYQYQFPDHLGRPKDDQAYITDEDVSISNSINQNEINKVDDTKTNDVDKTDVILSDDIELTEEQLLTNKAKEIQKLGPLSMFSIDKLKELVDPENASKLTSENPTVKNELNLLKKSGEARDKRLEKGDVWVSYNDPNPYMQTKGWTEAQKSKFWTDPITGEKKKIKSHNPYSIVGPMMDAKSDKQMIKTLGKFYGDGSDKYGEWLTTDEVAKMEHASAKLNAWRDNPNMQNSGRAQEINIMGDSPWNNPLINLAWLRYNPAGFMAWEAGSHVLNRVIESETGGPPLTGSIFSDIKNRPEVYQEAPPKTPGFIESLPDIWDNITNWPVFKQEGGSIPKAKDGRVVSEIWKDMTGTSWSQAKAQGLTDGSYAQNIALRNKLLSGELGEVTPAKSSNSFDYNAYDANVKRLVDKGYSLDDLVKTRMGTMSGLTNRFPDLFTEGSKEEELVEAVAPIETVEEVVTNPVVISNVVSDEDLGKWAMAAKLPAELQAKVDEIKNSPMAKAGDLDYARVVNELGRDALLKNYTPSNVEVTEKETVVEPYVKEDTQNILSLIKNADWASFGNALLDKVSTKTEPLLSALYDASSNASNYFKDRVETLELEALEAENLRRQGYTVEEIDDTSPEETRWNSGTPIDPYSSSTIKDNKPTFENWYLDKVKRYEQTQADEKNTFVPIMKNNIANNFRGQTDDGTGIMYEGPVTSVGQFAQSAGEYTDAAVGLPKKIYEGLSKEIKDVVNKIQKTSILPGSITDDALYKFGTSLVNKDYEALLENKYGQKLALKILDQNENPNKYMNLKLKTLSDQEQQWLRRGLEKAGAIDTPDEVLKLVKEKVVEESPRPQSFMEKVGDVKDSYDRKYKLLSYRNQWDNSEGFVYTTAPVQRDRKSSDTYSDVIGVGHFLLDASMDPTNPYNHGNNKAYIDKAMANDEWIPTFTNVGPHQVRLKYKKPADILETDIVSAPLRQFAFSDINFKSSQTPKGFRSTVKELTTKNGDGTYLLFKSKDGYSRFSGGSVVFIFEDSYGNTITRDFAGSLNSIQKEGVSIQKQYALEPGGLTVGYHDVGSFSAKPKANDNNVLKADQWKGYNNNGYTGGALLIPTSQPLSPKENRSQMKRMFPNTYNR